MKFCFAVVVSLCVSVNAYAQGSAEDVLAAYDAAPKQTFAQKAELFKKLDAAVKKVKDVRVEERRAQAMLLIVKDEAACSAKSKAFFKAQKKYFGCGTQDGETFDEGIPFARTKDLWKRADAAKDEALAWAIVPLTVTGQCEDGACDFVEETEADKLFLKRFPQSQFRTAIAERYAKSGLYDGALDFMDTSAEGYKRYLGNIDERLKIVAGFPDSPAKKDAVAKLTAFRAKVAEQAKSVE